MRLFLTSEAISTTNAPHFSALVGKPLSAISIAIIENAADVEKGDTSWVYENRTHIQQLGCQVEQVDLNQYMGNVRQELLATALGRHDVIWIGGGNTYYLRWLLRETGADALIQELARNGKVYGGGSAGAIVAGPTLRHFEAADDPAAAPAVVLDGLALTDTVVVPHWDDEKYGPIVHEADRKLREAGYMTQPITQAQAFVVQDDSHEVVG